MQGEQKMTDIKCFIINLEKDTDKKDQMLHVCEKNGIEPTFVKAVYGKELEKAYLDKVSDQAKAQNILGRKLTEGEIGVALSQLSIYQTMIDNDIDFALILEDDVDFSFEQGELKNIVKQLPQDWECVLLGHHTKRSRHIDTLPSIWNQKKVSQTHRLVRFAEGPMGAYGYLINKKGGEKRIKDFEIIDRPIDHWNDKKLNLYGITPSIIKVNDGFLETSLLSQERRSIEIKRTLFQKFKDKIQWALKKMKMLEMFYLLRNFLIQFKLPIKYCDFRNN